MKSAEEFLDKGFWSECPHHYDFFKIDCTDCCVALIRQAREEVRDECAQEIAKYFGIDPDGNHHGISEDDPWRVYEAVKKLDLK